MQPASTVEGADNEVFVGHSGDRSFPSLVVMLDASPSDLFSKMNPLLHALVTLPKKTRMLAVYPVSTLDQGSGSESGVDHCGCPLLLRDGFNAENTFHCTLYM